MRAMAEPRLKAWTYCIIITLLFFSGTCGEDMEEGDLLTLPTDINSPDDVEQIADWKERCRTEVGEQAVLDIEKSQENLMSCISKNINWEKLQHEINRSIQRGELDLVFKKYCGRREKLMVCVEDMFTKLELCLNDRERRDLNITREAIDAGLDFVCHNDGDRIALFMGEQGEECVKMQKDNIRKCVEERVPDVKEVEDNPYSISLNRLAINEKNCKNLNAIHQCIVEWTEKCNDSTPANILDSLIVQILKVTPCKQTSGADTLIASAQILLPRMLTLFAAALTAANILL